MKALSYYVYSHAHPIDHVLQKYTGSCKASDSLLTADNNTIFAQMTIDHLEIVILEPLSRHPLDDSLDWHILEEIDVEHWTVDRACSL
jgi:hypothetical protein